VTARITTPDLYCSASRKPITWTQKAPMHRWTVNLIGDVIVGTGNQPGRSLCLVLSTAYCTGSFIHCSCFMLHIASARSINVRFLLSQWNCYVQSVWGRQENNPRNLLTVYLCWNCFTACLSAGHIDSTIVNAEFRYYGSDAKTEHCCNLSFIILLYFTFLCGCVYGTVCSVSM